MWILEVIKYVIGLIMLVILAILIFFFGIYKNIRKNTPEKEHEEWKRQIQTEEKERDRKNPKIIEIKENIKKLLDEEIPKLEEELKNMKDVKNKNEWKIQQILAAEDLREKLDSVTYNNYSDFCVFYIKGKIKKINKDWQKKVENETPFLNYQQEWKEEIMKN